MKVDLIYTEDCQEGIPKRLPDESIDFMPTDPPYGIGFMGKEWDKFNEVVRPQGAYENVKGFKRLPRQSTACMEDFFIPRWQECLRVLKSGAFAFVMCSPRADVMATQILCLQEAGFMVGFTPIFWAYASGFPKAQNIGKAMDKRVGAEREVVGQKTCGYQVSISKKRQEEGYRPNLTRATKEVDITLPATPQAQALDGSYAGFQPKPAVEVIIVAMKPLSEKTYLDQALKNRKGIAWLGEGKIPYAGEKDKESARFGTQMDIRNNNYKTPKGIYGKNVLSSLQGRFPANLLVSDDALNDGKVSKTNSKGGIRKASNEFGQDSSWNAHKNIDSYRQGISDSGSFSRYFSLDSWFEKKLKKLPEGVQKTFPFLIVPKASKAEKNGGCEELYWEKDNSSFGYHQVDRQRWMWLGKEEKRIYKEADKKVSLRTRGNIHPTVKSLKLFCYLITLGSREGDVIVDPFMGSGTTAVATKMLARHYVGWETGLENVKIAKARLSILEPLLI